MNANSVVNLTLSVTDQFSTVTQAMGKAVDGLRQKLGELAAVVQRISPLFKELGSAAYLALTTNFVEKIQSIEKQLESLGLSVKKATAETANATEYQITAVLGSIAPVVDSALKGIIPQFDAAGISMAAAFKGLPSAVAASLNAVDKTVIGTIDLIQEKVERARERTSQIGDLFGFLSGVREPIGVFRDLSGLASGAATSIFNLTQQIGLFGLGIQALGQLVNSGPLQPLIGQNIELREQLLATQSSLAATNKVIQDGFEIKDPTKAIQALEAPVKQALAQIRKDSLDLVGVTSKELVPLFQIVAQNIGQAGGGLKDAQKLTIDFAAALGTLGVPLFQARQEIQSILQGTIDQNSIVAQNLNITSKQVEQWRAQGTLITELTNRLSAFRAGNALAAQEVRGLTSNIQEIVDTIGLIAGERLINPIAAQLNEIYKGLKQSQDAYAEYVGKLADYGLKAAQAVVSSVGAIATSTGDAFKQIPLYLFQSLANAATALAKAIETTLKVLQPFINLFAELSKVAIAAGGPFLQLFLQFKVASVAIGVMSRAFGTLSQVIEPLGSILFVLAGRSSGLIGLFTGLTSVVGQGAAGFLLLGKNLANIPGGMNAIIKAIPLFGSVIAPLIPQLSEFGIGLVSLSRRFPVVRELMSKFIGTIPEMALQMQKLAASNGLPLLADLFGKLGAQTDFAATLNTKFSEAVTKASIAARNAAIRMGLITAAFIAAGFAFDKFVLQNKDLLNALGSFVSFSGEVGSAILNFLTNPIVAATIAVSGLTVAIQAKLIPSILALSATAGSKLLLVLLNLAGALVSLETTLGGLGFAQMAVSAGQASGAIAGLNLAATSGALTFKALTAAVGEFALGVAGLVAPLALAAAGIAAIGLIRYTKDLKESQEAFDIYAEQATNVGDQAIAIASKLTAAKKQQEEATKNGIALSAQEYESNRRLAQSGRLRLEDVKAQIAILQQAKTEAVGPELKQAFDSQIANLTVTQKLLEGLVNTVQLVPRDITNLGTKFEQMAQKANTALKAIDNPSGDKTIFDKRIQDLQESTEFFVEYGRISYEEAVSRYRKIIENADTTIEQQVKAEKALTVLIKQEGDRRAAAIDGQIKAQENAIRAGAADEIEGDQEVTKLKLEQIQIRLDAVKEQLATEAALGNGAGANTKQLLAERQALEAEAQSVSLEAYQRYLDKQMELIGRQTSRITDEITAAEQERNLQIQQLINDRQITATQADELRVSSTRQRIEQELALERAFQQELLSQQRPNDPAKVAEYEKRVRDSKLKTAQLTLQLAQEEERQQEAVAKVAQERVDKQLKSTTTELQRQRQAYEQQINLLNRVGDALSTQNKILEQRKALTSSVSGFLQSQFKLLADTAKTEEEKARYARAAAVERLRYLREEQQMARVTLELQLQQQRLADATALRQNQVDQLSAVADVKQAQADLGKAQASPTATKEDLDALSAQLEAKQQKVLVEQQKGQALGQTAVLNRQNENIQRGTLALSQRSAIDQARVDLANTLPEGQKETIINQIRNDILKGLGFGKLTRDLNRDASREARQRSGSAAGSDGFTSNATGVNTYAPDLRILQGGKGLRQPEVSGIPATVQYLQTTASETALVRKAVEAITQQLPALGAQLLQVAGRSTTTIQKIQQKTVPKQPILSGSKL